ncbi:Rieske (2Fe-2S) domain protein [Catenulispora acidiphila DSM 44928]|uniref:Cytochrome bc1 complex Rieske iron-sulfur subunit n=1 Tax=Catenulispora acidiphila (strain DSM 44928 / JCM 14897 / NBRC 102108 / NRRL B-24433 / ID139908) TaxID=479433 RepID=C7QBM3_CATAD|nr:Rieske 2Fe-2S domain-containing protein [Catenulispora acidiphila]ACU70600.1 Rieske (2Fe-2S) domain protein [Catenulispora acidiphila DSM 44928]
MTDRDMETDHLPENTGGAGHGTLTKEAVAENPFQDPGLPAYRPRVTDIDARAAKRAERQVALLFLIAIVGLIGSMVCYTFIPNTRVHRFTGLGTVNMNNLALGLCLGFAFLALGGGAIHWARTLMTDVDLVQERHPMKSDPESTAFAVSEFKQGVADSGFTKYPLIRRSLLTAMLVLPLPAVWLLRDLGPMPKDSLRHTLWAPGQKLVNPNTGQPLKVSDVTVGTLALANPAALADDPENRIDNLAKAAVLVVRLPQDALKGSDAQKKKQWDWSVDGVMAFSKICTHVGCPVALYEQQTHHMLCPCHQSTFDLSDDGKVIFGPAARSLPQLHITADADGNLVAVSDFQEPVGPSFWERG